MIPAIRDRRINRDASQREEFTMPGWFNRLGAACAVLAAAVYLTSAHAETWPARPVKVIVPYAPGGGTDATGRTYAEKLSAIYGQQFVVDNRAGASGMIGIEACAKSPGDGYTLCIVPLATVAVLPNVRKTAYDPFKDFTPVGRVTDAIFAFAVGEMQPWKTLQEFIADAKKAPGKYTMSSSGIATITHLSVAAVQLAAGIEAVHVPYKGGAEQLQDALSGQVNMMFEGNAYPHHKAGKMRILAVSTPYRHPQFPDIPSVREILPGFDVPNWFAVYGPAGLAPEIVAGLSENLNKIGDMPDVQERTLAMGVKPVRDTPQGAAAELKKRHAALGDLVRKLNIRLD
jgi:tripartite-type tricarboxylate transporter receptor subunit TctC